MLDAALGRAEVARFDVPIAHPATVDEGADSLEDVGHEEGDEERHDAGVAQLGTEPPNDLIEGLSNRAGRT